MNSAFQPKISVIVPVYNAEKYLPFALRSLCNQTYKNLEIIVVNDGSCDNSLYVAQQWSRKDKRIIVYTQENKGVSATRNFAIQNATGEYLGFLDADDFLHPKFYEYLVHKLQDDPQLEMVSFETKIVRDHDINKTIHDDGNWNIARGKFRSPEELYKLAIKDHFGNITARIIRRSVWGDILFKEGVIYEDV